MTGRHHQDDAIEQGRTYCCIGQRGLLIHVYSFRLSMSMPVAPGYTHMSFAPEQSSAATNRIVGFFQ